MTPQSNPRSGTNHSVSKSVHPVPSKHEHKKRELAIRHEVMESFYEASQTSPDPITRALAWGCYLNMKREETNCE